MLLLLLLSFDFTLLDLCTQDIKHLALKLLSIKVQILAVREWEIAMSHLILLILIVLFLLRPIFLLDTDVFHVEVVQDFAFLID